MFQIIKWIRQLLVRRQTVPDCCVWYDKFFWPEHVSFKGCFSFKTEDLVFDWFFDQIVYMYHENVKDKFP